MNEESPKPSKDQAGTMMALGIGMGVAIGAGLGVAMDNIAMGMGMGIAIGAGLGAALGAARKDDKSR